MSEKHGLALLCAFMVSWTLIRTASRHPSAVSDEPLDPEIIPFIVVPPDFGHGVHLGDYAAVTYGGKTVYAVVVVGDIGSSGVVGEGSPATARPLNIPSDKNTGGVSSGVTYTILPGSQDSSIPRTAAKIKIQAQAKFQERGISTG